MKNISLGFIVENYKFEIWNSVIKIWKFEQNWKVRLIKIYIITNKYYMYLFLTQLIQNF